MFTSSGVAGRGFPGDITFPHQSRKNVVSRGLQPSKVTSGPGDRCEHSGCQSWFGITGALWREEARAGMLGGWPRVTSRGVVFDDDHVNLVLMF